ncbi:MAG: hypothetical protein KF753_25095 [Caldilineaceae bacterium]|nr:hypothetical protein [Caldilineaceae bacterium]
MKKLKPKEQHERLLANVDKEQIMQHLSVAEHDGITKLAVALARQCNLFVHFKRLWLMRVSDLDEKLGSERYMQNIYVNRRALYKLSTKTASPKKNPTGHGLPKTDTEL